MAVATWAELGLDPNDLDWGENYRSCPKCSPNREKAWKPCLSVNRERGVFNCHHCGWSGRVSDHDGLTTDTSMYQEKSYGLAPDRPLVPLPQEALDWFAARGIPQDVLEIAGVQWGKGGKTPMGDPVWMMFFPYYRGGEVVNRKRRPLDKKLFYLERDCELVPYGMDDISPTEDTVIIVEGEIDKLSYHAAGITNVLSVPNGAPPVNAKNAERHLNWLNATGMEALHSRVQKWILDVDNDDPGRALEQLLSRRLNREKVFVTRKPDGCKDANDVLVKHGPEALREMVQKARPLPVQGLWEANDPMIADALEREWEDDSPEAGYSLGFASLDNLIRVAPGNFMVVTGIPGMGKGEFIDQVAVNLAVQYGWHTAFFSPENNPLHKHVRKLIEKRVGMSLRGTYGEAYKMDRDTMREARKWVDEHFTFVLPTEDDWRLDKLLKLFEHAIYSRGARTIVLDPWNEISHVRTQSMDRSNETDVINGELSRIKRFGQKHEVLTCLVAHPTKLQPRTDQNGNDTYPVPKLYDISGCYSSDTEVLTARGWVKHPEVTLEDEVAGFDPATGTWAYARPSKVWEYDYAGEMYRFSGYGFDGLVTPNHRMLVEPIWRGYKPVQTRATKYAEEGWTFVEAQDVASSLNIPLATARAGDVPDLDTIQGIEADAALQVLGWWISEGWGSMGSLAFCQATGPLQERMRATLEGAGLSFSSRVTHYRESERPLWVARLYKRAHAAFVEWVLAEVGEGCENKRLPALVWSLSKRQQRLLLDALIEGDGTVTARGTWRYFTTSRQLADDVMRLAIELGHPSSILDQSGAKAHHKRRYTVGIGRLDRTKVSISKARSITREPYAGKVYCLTMPTGAYITRRNGKMLVAGNSAHFANRADFGLAVHRDISKTDQNGHQNFLDVYVHKARWKEQGQPGMARLQWDRVSGRLTSDLSRLAPATVPQAFAEVETELELV